jgi:hypothetical protein
MRKKELFLKARHEIKKIAEELKPKPIYELRNYVSKDVYDKIDINGSSIDIMIWAEDHGPNRIAVVSIPRQSRGLYDCWPLKGA